MMEKTVDGRLAFRGQSDCRGACRVRVWKADGQMPVVLVQDYEDDGDCPVMHSAEQLAELIWHKLKQPEEYLYLEYTSGLAEFGIEFDVLVFGIAGRGEDCRPGRAVFEGGAHRDLMAAWLPVSRETVEELIGGPLED